MEIVMDLDSGRLGGQYICPEEAIIRCLRGNEVRGVSSSTSSAQPLVR